MPFSILNLSEVSYNEYYKLQIRFSSDDGGTGLTGQTLSQYLTNESNLEDFSEWSTVCLISFIAEPNIVLNCNGTAITETISIETSQVTITGRYNKIDPSMIDVYPQLAGNQDSEYLNVYRFEVYKQNENQNYEVLPHHTSHNGHHQKMYKK